MKQLVMQQLGDKSNYDSTLVGLDSSINPDAPGGDNYIGTPAGT